MTIQTFTATIDADNEGRVDLAIRQLTGSSRSQIRGIVDHGCVFINDSPCNSVATAVAAGDVLSVRFDPTQRYYEKRKSWDDRTFSIAFEDEQLIVVDKAAGTLTVPTDDHEENTLIDRVSIYLSHSRQKREACLVHRLDRDVSGLLVFAKTPEMAGRLIEQFKLRKPQRIYQALVAGLVEKERGTFRSHLATGKNLDRYATRPSKKTEEAITHFEVLQRLRDTTFVKVVLETGRRNQIRVHFADAGHPILGDPRYGKALARHPRWIRKRIALHAGMLGFEHPLTGQSVTIESPLPSSLKNFLAGNR